MEARDDPKNCHARQRAYFRPILCEPIMMEETAPKLSILGFDTDILTIVNNYTSSYFEGKQADVAYCLISPYLLVGLRKCLNFYKIEENNQL